jgi:hypothetical protein
MDDQVLLIQCGSCGQMFDMPDPGGREVPYQCLCGHEGWVTNVIQAKPAARSKEI